MSAVQILLSIVIVVLLAWSVLVTVLFLRAIERMHLNADRAHERATEQQNSLLDRLMANNFAEFKMQQMAEKAPQGGYEGPDEVEDEITPLVMLPGLETSH